MQRLPLSGRLKRRAHRGVAFAQDVLVTGAYDAFPGYVLHGGTAIWRCYGGTRFSEDVDGYLPGYTVAGEARFREGLAAKGVKEVKFKKTSGTVFGTFELGGAVVSFDGALRAPARRVMGRYETLGGGSMLVWTLSADDLLVEKAAAYGERRKVRDLYDALFLLDRVGDRAKAARAVRAMLKRYAPPVDEPGLKTVVLAGAIPTSDEMRDALERWARRST